jgi:energy-coupling factor transport system ATP-binding protein
VIEVQNVSYSHPGQTPGTPPALKEISLSIAPGEFVALIGANGSGKTTLARMMNALLVPNTGNVKIDGLDTRDRQAQLAIHAAVGMVFQHPEDQMVATIVEEDVAFGPENLGLEADEIRERVKAALEATGMWERRERPPHMLSAGQMQRVALAGILAMRPRYIIFDEATAMLDPSGRHKVMEIMRRLHAEGLTVIYVTHFMEDVVWADRVIVLEHGSVAIDASPREVFRDLNRLEAWKLEPPPATVLARLLWSVVPGFPETILTGEELLAAIPSCPAGMRMEPSVDPKPAIAEEAARTPVVQVNHLSYTYLRGTPLEQAGLEEVSLRVDEREAHGVIGATGSGKSTLLQHLNGLMRPQAGTVQVGSFDLNDPKTTLKEVCQYAGLVFQNPESQIFEQYVGDEIAYGPRHFLEREALRERVRWALELVGLDFDEFKDRMTRELSGGERRKVALASVLALHPSLLILDEPTAGLDPISRRELRHNLKELKKAGLTLVLSSHQMEDMALLADRVTVMKAGRDIFEGPAWEVFSHEDVLNDLGLEAPMIVQVVKRLQAQGWPVPDGVLGQDELKSWLLRCRMDDSSPTNLVSTGDAQEQSE